MLIFDLAAWWLIIWLVKNAAMDVTYAVKGGANPRYELKKARAKAAGQPAPASPRYGGREWAADLLGDGLQAQTEWRRRRAVEKAEKRAAAGQPVDDMVDLVREDRPAATVAAPERVGRPEPVASGPGTDTDEEWLNPTRADRDAEAGGEPTPVVHNGVTVSTANAGKWAWACRRPGCPGKGFDFATNEEAQAGATQHRCADTGRRPIEGVQITGGPQPGPAAGPWAHSTPVAPTGVARSAANGRGPVCPGCGELRPAGSLRRTCLSCAAADTRMRERSAPPCRWCDQPIIAGPHGIPQCGCRNRVDSDPGSTIPELVDDRPDAQIIPLFRITVPTKENAMTATATTTEVQGLDQAINYATALAGFAGEHGQAGNEGYIGYLTDSKVSGQGLSTAHEMQEAFANAAAVAERHAAELAKQRTVQEAYDQNPDAGDKQFQQAGR